MLNHELELMRQVDELHQFYKIKTNMMENSPWKRFDDYNLHKGALQFIPENKTCSPQCSRSFYTGFIQKHIDLQLPADEFISHYVDDIDNIELTLGLSIGQSKAKNSKPSERNNTHCSSNDKRKLESFLQIGMNHIQYGSQSRESVSDLCSISQTTPASLLGCIDLFSKNQSSRTCWNKATVIDLCESSDNKHRQLDLNIDLTNSYEENNEGEICVIDLDSDSGQRCSSNKSNPKIESVDSSSKFLNNLACKTDCVDAEPNAQTTQVAPDDHPNSPNQTNSSISDHMSDDQSNNLKTKQSSDNTESNIHYINNKKLEADEMAQKAAESLVKISLEARVCHNQPQHSSDSYERMVLWAKEGDPDDFCISSNAFVVDELDNKVISKYKLKRGTRMKDFQKDVLPSLSMLSRNEIKEDVNIMEGVIRSREYKKMRAKMGDDGEWLKVGRNKRSRAGYNKRYHQ